MPRSLTKKRERQKQEQIQPAMKGREVERQRFTGWNRAAFFSAQILNYRVIFPTNKPQRDA